MNPLTWLADRVYNLTGPVDVIVLSAICIFLAQMIAKCLAYFHGFPSY